MDADCRPLILLVYVLPGPNLDFSVWGWALFFRLECVRLKTRAQALHLILKMLFIPEQIDLRRLKILRALLELRLKRALLLFLLNLLFLSLRYIILRHLPLVQQHSLHRDLRLVLFRQSLPYHLFLHSFIRLSTQDFSVPGH